MKPSSQCGRILALLSDGRWHTHHELYRLGCVAHSRVAELRKRGHVIEHRRIGDPGPDAVYEYRLTTTAKPGRADEEVVTGSAPRMSDPVSVPAQLALLEVV